MTDHLISEPQHWRDRAVEALQRADQISDPEAKCAMQDIAAGYERLAQEAERLRATPQRHRSALDPGPRAGEKLKLADRGRQKTIPQLLASGVSVRYHRPQHSTDPRQAPRPGAYEIPDGDFKNGDSSRLLLDYAAGVRCALQERAPIEPQEHIVEKGKPLASPTP
jgi:hypothetical protein